MENYNITLEEAKKKDGYKFWTLYEDMDAIRNYLKNGNICDVMAVLELSHIDIEWTNRGYDDSVESEYPINDYFCCIKHEPNRLGGDGWESDDGVDFGYKLPVNFTTIEELEQDMFNQLIKYAEKNNLNLYDRN